MTPLYPYHATVELWAGRTRKDANNIRSMLDGLTIMHGSYEATSLQHIRVLMLRTMRMHLDMLK